MPRAFIKGYAKINLVLDVLQKRPDGYHEVAMVMQAINLTDTIILEKGSKNWLYTGHRHIPVNMSNLAMKAVVLMQKNFAQVPPLSVILHKNIPVAAGLAGGSTDCAAVLLGINQLCQLGLSLSQLAELGAQLGSDVPFCLQGPTALATGRGEIIKPLAPCPKLYFVLVKPNFGVSTPKAYGNLRLDEIEQHPSVQRCVDAILAADKTGVLHSLGNLLEHSTFQLHPSVQQLKAEMEDAGAGHVLMSGSGPTVFAAFDCQKQAQRFYEQMKNRYTQVFLTETADEKQLEERVQIR